MQVDAIVFLVDAADPERFNEAKKELDVLLSEDYLAKVMLYSEWFQHLNCPNFPPCGYPFVFCICLQSGMGVMQYC
jgi:hypothetical protein